MISALAGIAWVGWLALWLAGEFTQRRLRRQLKAVEAERDAYKAAHDALQDKWLAMAGHWRDDNGRVLSIGYGPFGGTNVTTPERVQ